MRVNRRVSIWKHVRLADRKWRYCRPVLDAKGRIVPDVVRVNGSEERHAEGTYCICFYNPKLTWQKCGPKPADAAAAAERQRALFKAMDHGIVQRPSRVQTMGTIEEAVSTYLEELEAKVDEICECGGQIRDYLPNLRVAEETTANIVRFVQLDCFRHRQTCDSATC